MIDVTDVKTIPFLYAMYNVTLVNAAAMCTCVDIVHKPWLDARCNHIITKCSQAESNICGTI